MKYTMKATRGRARTPKASRNRIGRRVHFARSAMRPRIAFNGPPSLFVSKARPVQRRESLEHCADSRRGVLVKPLPRFRRRLLRACPSRCSRNAFFAGFLSIAHGVYGAASVVGLRCRGARPEVGEHFGVGALCASGAIEFCQ